MMLYLVISIFAPKFVLNKVSEIQGELIRKIFDLEKEHQELKDKLNEPKD